MTSSILLETLTRVNPELAKFGADLATALNNPQQPEQEELWILAIPICVTALLVPALLYLNRWHIQEITRSSVTPPEPKETKKPQPAQDDGQRESNIIKGLNAARKKAEQDGITIPESRRISPDEQTDITPPNFIKRDKRD